MKKTALMTGIVAVLLAVPVVAVYAQTNEVNIPVPMTTSVSGSVRLNIPFNFTVGKETLPAGEYWVSVAHEKTVMIKGSNSKSIVALTSAIMTGGEESAPKLIFHKYGDRYFLAQAWLRYSNSGREFFAAPDEVRLTRELHQQQVTLVASK